MKEWAAEVRSFLFVWRFLMAKGKGGGHRRDSGGAGHAGARAARACACGMCALKRKGRTGSCGSISTEMSRWTSTPVRKPRAPSTPSSTRRTPSTKAILWRWAARAWAANSPGTSTLRQCGAAGWPRISSAQRPRGKGRGGHPAGQGRRARHAALDDGSETVIEEKEASYFKLCDDEDLF